VFLSNSDGAQTGLKKYRLNALTSLHWVNENTCLLQIEQLDENSNQSLLKANEHLQQWTAMLVSRAPPWLENYVPAYTSLLISHSLEQADKFAVLVFLQELAGRLEDADARQNDSVTGGAKDNQKHHLIKVCYDATLSNPLKKRLPNDLALVSGHTNLSVEQIISLHTQIRYRVFTVGFLPNFAYMGLTDERLAMPRLQSPRKKVPAGALAIADNQTAIYPQESPGGWHILGYTPLDLGINSRLQFKAGDTVSFQAIDTDEYYQICSLQGQEQ